MKSVVRAICTGLTFFAICITTYAEEEAKLFKDSIDGAFDISSYLFDLNGFLPVPSIITEPALGYGGVLAGVYFIEKPKTDKNTFKMPDIVGAAAGYTQNGSWFAGAGYYGFWKDDKIRYRGVAGYGNINLKYYGAGGGILEKYPVSFTINSFFFLQQGIFRVKNSNFLLGGKYVFAKTKVELLKNLDLPVNPLDFNLTSSGLGLIAEYETLDNILSPSKGVRLNLSYDQFLEFLGSDRQNGKISFFTHAFVPINPVWFSGFRVESNWASESTPFYMMPYINLRGVPMLRYQGEFTGLVETEQQAKVYNRWSAVAFTGIGKTWNFSDGTDGQYAWNAGGGFRYLIARMLNLQMGMDVARGPEDWAFYVVLGSSWNK